MFVNFLSYKQEKKGKHITQINQYAPSSKTCSCCGHKMDKMALDIRQWICPGCGAEHDRDLNAALNILWWGMAATDYALFKNENKNNTEGTSGINACGDTSTYSGNYHYKVSMKQETCTSLGCK